MSTKTVKPGISKDNLNQIINALGTAVLYKLINGAVAIGGETTNLTALKAAVDEAVESVADKANVDGNYPTMSTGKSDVSDNWTPYSDDSGTEQDEPFVSQGTGCGNGTEIVTTGDYAQLREKRGNTLPVAQLAKELNDTNWASSSANATWNSGEVSFVASTKYGRVQQITAIQNHKYLLKAEIKLTSATTDVKLAFLHNDNYPVQATPVEATTSWQTIIVVKDGSTDYKGICVFDGRESGFDAIQVKNVICFGITSWPADVITDLTAHPENFFRYYNGSLAYNAGSLENADGVKLVCTGRNIYDPSKTYNIVAPNTSFNYKGGSATTITYYDIGKNSLGTESVSSGSQFTTPPNCVFINSSVTSGVTITPYYTSEQGGEGYDQYYEYEAPTVIDTGSEALRSADSAHDVKLPSGVITRNVNTYTFTGNETINKSACAANNGHYFFAISLPESTPGAKGTGDYWSGTLPNVTDDMGLIPGSQAQVDYYGADNKIFISGRNVHISVNSFDEKTTTEILAYLTCKTNYYCLSTPTTEQGTPFPENVDIDDYGMMYWLDGNDELVGIPQGAKFFYPVNYKGFTDDLYNRTDGNAGNVVVQSELSARDSVDAQLKEALGGTLRQLLAATKSIDFVNTNYTDLGNFDWTYTRIAGGAYGFMATINSVKYQTVSSSLPNLLCSEYRTITADQSYAGSKVGISTLTDSARVTIYDPSAGTDATAFKAAMKGVLLAYEKASS